MEARGTKGGSSTNRVEKRRRRSGLVRDDEDMSDGLRMQRYDLGLVLSGDAEVHDDDDDCAEEQNASDRRAESETPVGSWLGEVVAERGTKRSGEDVGHPKSGDGVEIEDVVGSRDGTDQSGEEQERYEIAEVEPFRGEVARGRSEREREEDGEPVETLAARGVDRVDG